MREKAPARNRKEDRPRHRWPAARIGADHRWLL
jgi:hypothetical protein